MKSILLFVFLLGIFMVLFGYSKSYQKCPEPQIEYRYIPRSFYEEQMSPSDIFKSFNGMFNNKDTWFSYPTNVDSS